MPAVLTIGKTELKYGYFYILHNCREIDIGGFPEPTDGWIVSPSPDGEDHGRSVVDGYKTRRVQRFKCSKNPEHGKEDELRDYDVDLINVRLPLTPFVSEHDHVVVNEWLADRLKSSGLKGFRLLPATIFAYPMRYEKDGRTPIAKMFQLTFDGQDPDAHHRVEPPSANRCPFCGTEPLLCPECGFFDIYCPNCEERWNVPAYLHEGADDRRVKIEALGRSIPVIDPRRWDGTDFMGHSHGGYITRRALDWLLSIHAGPFIAQPIAVNVFGLTKPELEHLEMARKPLQDVKPPRLEDFSKNPDKATK